MLTPPPPLLVTWSLGHLVTWLLGYLVTWSFTQEEYVTQVATSGA
jgi:hypothetical protein